MKQLVDCILTLHTHVSCLIHIFVHAFEMPHFRYQLQTWLLYFPEHWFLMALKEFRRKEGRMFFQVGATGYEYLLNFNLMVVVNFSGLYEFFSYAGSSSSSEIMANRTLNLEQGTDDHSISQGCKQTDAYKTRCNINRNWLKLLKIRKKIRK